MTEEERNQLKEEVRRELLAELQTIHPAPPKPWDRVNQHVTTYIKSFTNSPFEAAKIKPIFTHAVRHVFRIPYITRLNMRDVERAECFAQELIALLKKYRNKEDVVHAGDRPSRATNDTHS